MKRIILDTNAYRKVSDAYAPVIEILETAAEVYMSPIVLGELLAGFKKGRQEKRNKTAIETFLHNHGIRTIEIGKDTSDIYAAIKHTLEKLGKPVPTNDIWIASQAVETGSVLVSYDEHFKQIPGLRIWGE